MSRPRPFIQHLSLGPRATIVASGGALIAWIGAWLGTIQIAYMRDANALLDHDVALTVGALAGLTVTIGFIFARSRLGTGWRWVLGATCLAAFVTLIVWGGLTVACMNGNCL
jgi:hypothetical protein